MSKLKDQKCSACQPDAPAVLEDEIIELHYEIPDWDLTTVDSIKRLKRLFIFKDYASALDFTNKVAQLAEEEGHHPEIILEWGKVTVSWWTHKIKNLHKNDFIMSAKTDLLYGQN